MRIILIYTYCKSALTFFFESSSGIIFKSYLAACHCSLIAPLPNVFLKYLNRVKTQWTLYRIYSSDKNVYGMLNNNINCKCTENEWEVDTTLGAIYLFIYNMRDLFLLYWLFSLSNQLCKTSTFMKSDYMEKVCIQFYII